MNVSSAEEVVARVQASGLLRSPVLVMVSGGRDSVCLLDLAVRICGAQNVTALHVNYGLRAGAEGDEEHVRVLCERLRVAAEVRYVRPAESCGNLQAWARAERYAAATELAAPRGAVIAAAHTASDQVETILYRLASSPSRRALLGMRPVEELAPRVALIRPLLSYTREDTTRYCQARGLVWRDDPTNVSETNARSRIRSHLVPALREVHPAAETNVLALAEILRGEADVLDELIEEVLAGRDHVELARLRALPPALRRLVVQALADRALGRPAAGVARRSEDLLGLKSGQALDLPAVRAQLSQGSLSFRPHT